MCRNLRPGQSSANTASSCPARVPEHPMDWTALALSLRLGTLTVMILLPIGMVLSRWLAYRSFRGKGIAEAALALPLVLPPTVVGYYLLVSFGGSSPLGQAWQRLFG